MLSTKGESNNRMLLAALAGASALVLSVATAQAEFFGCNSGDTPNINLLSSNECQATALGLYSLAVGHYANAGRDATFVWGGTAIGGHANAPADWSTAVGIYSRASGNSSTAIGGGDYDQDGGVSIAARALADFSIAIGAGGLSTLGTGNVGAVANGSYGIAMGTNGSAASEGIGIGLSAIAGYRSVAIGSQSGIGSDFGTSVGFNSKTAFASTAIGTDTTATGDSSTAIGRFSGATAASTIAVGVGSSASGDQGSAVGGSSIASGIQATSVGYDARATDDAATALGGTTRATANSATAIGFGSRATALSATAIGASNTASGLASSALGDSSKAVAKNSLALGANSAAGGDGSATGAIAVGAGAQATKLNSVALGLGSQGDVANAVSVGSTKHERRIVHVAPAVKPTDAVNLAQVQAMIAAIPVLNTLAAGTKDRSGKKVQLATLGGSAPSSARDHYSIDHSGKASGGAQEEQPAASGRACQFTGSRMTAAIDHQTIASTTFGRVEQSGISFIQGKQGCAALTFSAETALNGGHIEVKAVLDGGVEILPWASHIPSDNPQQMHTFNFVFVEVAPGPHRIELHARNAKPNGPVKLGTRSSTLQFAK